MEISTLADRVYNELRVRILRGDYQPGEKLNLTHLVDQLQVSNTPIREAIARLERVGLVEIVPYSSPRVKALSGKQILDIFDVRIALEELAVRLATEYIDQHELAMMDAAIRQQEKALQYNDPDQFKAADRQFHDVIVQASDNSVLIDMLPTLSDRTQLLLDSYDQSHQPNAWIIKGHQEVYQALRTKDADTASRVLREMLLRGKAGLVSFLQRTMKEETP